MVESFWVKIERLNRTYPDFYDAWVSTRTLALESGLSIAERIELYETLIEGYENDNSAKGDV